MAWRLVDWRNRARNAAAFWAGVALGAISSIAWLAASERTRDTAYPSPSRLWTSPHFIYESREADGAVCPGILGTLERHRDAVMTYLGITGPSARIRYLKFRNPLDLRASGHCSLDSAACFFASVGIETHQRFERHELMHAYLAPLGDSHKLLEEGVAEAFSCGAESPLAEQVTWESAFSLDVWRSSNVVERRHLYRAGAWFVGYLLRNYPRAWFLRLYQDAEPVYEGAQVAALFEAIYAEPLGTVWQRALGNADPRTPCIYAYECAAPALQQAPLARWNEACDASDQFRTVKTSVPLAVTERARQEAAWVLGCEGGPEPPYASSLTPNQRVPSGAAFSYVLGPGRYAYAATESATEIRLADPAVRFVTEAKCAELEPLRSEGAERVLFAVSQAWAEQLVGSKLTITPPSPAGLLDLGAEQGSTSGTATWMVGWEDPKIVAGKLHMLDCGPGLQLALCSSCSVDDCQQLCDSNVRGQAVRLPQGGARFRGRSAGDTWFSLRRAVR